MLICQQSHAQKYSWFEAVTDTNRQVIYRTDFDKVDSNNADWEDPIEPEDSLCYSYIKNGTLEITNKTDTSTLATIFPFMIDYSRDFEIEFSARLDLKYTDWAALLFWGRDSTVEVYNGQFLYYYPKGGYSMTYCKGSYPEPCDYKRTMNAFGYGNNKGGYNTYTIRKIKDRYYVFVNDRYSRRYDYIPLNGQLLGFGTGRKSVANMDYIQVSYLKLD